MWSQWPPGSSASRSARSAATTSASEAPQAARNAPTLVPSTAGSTEALGLLARSWPLAQGEAWRLTLAAGAYLRTMATTQRPRPAMLFSWPAQSVGLALATAAGSACGSLPACWA